MGTWAPGGPCLLCDHGGGWEEGVLALAHLLVLLSHSSHGCTALGAPRPSLELQSVLLPLSGQGAGRGKGRLGLSRALGDLFFPSLVPDTFLLEQGLAHILDQV